ncbi:MAG TPA: D-amino acid dehydrogenase [Casimicrobiaceae bacterium]|nr:D-amino acid dehydrogenase [Casimicrobiaceae bacterium]
MKLLVLGAGVVGTTTAWYLAEAAHQVTVVERQSAAALETSFANGGQISVSHVEPWATPAAPWRILRWLTQADAPLLFRPSLDPRQWLWGLEFLRECLPSRTRRNMLQILAISKYSGEMLRELRRTTGLTYDDLQRGILQIYTDPAGYDAAAAAAKLVRSYGIAREVKTAAECVAIEPALRARRDWIVGGTYTASDESGDARKFTQGLAALAARRGVDFRYGVTIDRLDAAAGSIAGVAVRAADGDGATRAETLTADAYVACLSSHTARLLHPLGIPVPVYPAKGYSATLPIVDPAAAPTVSMTDDAKKIVFTRLGNRLRVAGTAELSGYKLDLNRIRCEALTRRASEWFGTAIDAARAEYWTGLRPATPSNVPLIGRTRYPNLYLNTGHGTLGWTMAAGSGKAVAELVSGRVPDIGFDFVGYPRRDAGRR